jgi:hypothetical protein
MRIFKHQVIVALLPWLLLSGYCFDLTQVKQVPAHLGAAEQTMPSFVLEENLAVPLESWSTTHLNAGTIWSYVGMIEQGRVYKSKDQTVTVWGSNLYEAYPIIKDEMLYGFYLPVEKTFSAISKPIAVKLRIIKPTH